MSETQIAKSPPLAKGLFVAIKKQHEFQEFVKLDKERLEKKSSRSKAKKDELDHLNVVFAHSSSVKKNMWLKFNELLQGLMQSNRICIADNLGEPSSSEDLEVVDFVLKYVTTRPELRKDLPVPLANPTTPES